MAGTIYYLLIYLRTVAIVVNAFINSELSAMVYTPQPSSTRAMVSTTQPTTTLPVSTTLHPSIDECAEFICDEGERRHFLVYKVYSELLGDRRENTFLREFAAKPLVERICDRLGSRLSRQWMLRLFDTDGDLAIGNEEQKECGRTIRQNVVEPARRKRHHRLRHHHGHSRQSRDLISN